MKQVGVDIGGNLTDLVVYRVEIAAFDRDDLEYGMTIREPCVIGEMDAAFFMPIGCVARIDQYGNILVQLQKVRERA